MLSSNKTNHQKNSKLPTHFRIISNFAWKFILFGLPAIGIFIADSVLWNIIWWILYLSWGFYFAKLEILSKTCIGTIWAQIPYIILLDIGVNNIVAWFLAGLWAVLCYLHIYRQAILMNSVTE